MPLKMCIIVCFIWLVTYCFTTNVFWLSKEVSAVFGIRCLKSGLRAAKPSLSPYVQNIYRIEVKYVFLEVVHRGLSWEFFSDFSFFRYCTAPVENYWHWLLKRCIVNKTSQMSFWLWIYSYSEMSMEKNESYIQNHVINVNQMVKCTLSRMCDPTETN